MNKIVSIIGDPGTVEGKHLCEVWKEAKGNLSLRRPI